MAAPRVFISSTCYDLAEVRDSLTAFCQNFGFEIIMSDKGDVFYHPDLHTHESCVGEVSNCQLFILIIGGRFGGKYKVDPSKSITNAEYMAARESGIPVFTFVKDTVLSDHNVYQTNRDKGFSSKIEYPSIEKQEYAKKIFDFIDLVRSSDVNNGFFGFKYARDLHNSLRKQWAGMFFEFLSERSVSNQLKSTNDSINNLSIASKKIEELIKNIYRQVDSARANENIQTIDMESEATKFFTEVGKKSEESTFISPNVLNDIPDNLPQEWWTFLTKYGDFFYVEGVRSSDRRKTDIIAYEPNSTIIGDIDGELSSYEVKRKKKLQSYYESFLALSESSKRNVLARYISESSD